MPQDRFEQAYADDREFVLHSWSVQGAISPKVVTKGEGIYFWDKEGNKYMDFASQLMNLNIGFSHPKVVEAIKKQADDLPYVAPQFANDARSTLARRIIGLLPDNFGKCFFTVGGADANENAIKIARAYTGRHKILSRFRSYHGATYGAIALTGDPRRPPVEPAMPGVIKCFDPYCYRCSFGHTHPNCGMECAEHIREMIMYENPDTVAAIIMESVTGSNGIFVPPTGYMERVREICDEFGILLICDEVMTGFGRTGKWFGFQNYDIKPDIVTMAKGVNSGYVPLGVVAVSSAIASHYEDKMLYCGLTYSGHPLSCAAALGNLDAYEEDNLIAHSAAMGEVLKEELEAMMQRHPCVGEYRSIGLFAAMEIVKSRETREPMVPWNGAPGVMADVGKACLEAGLSLFIRWNYVFIVPPIIITEAELRDGLSRLDKALELADAALEKAA